MSVCARGRKTVCLSARGGHRHTNRIKGASTNTILRILTEPDVTRQVRDSALRRTSHVTVVCAECEVEEQHTADPQSKGKSGLREGERHAERERERVSHTHTHTHTHTHAHTHTKRERERERERERG